MSRIHFFTTSGDMLLIAGEVDRKLDLKAILSFDLPVSNGRLLPVTEYPNIRSIPDLGVATSGDNALSVEYALIDRSIDLKPILRDIGTQIKRCVMRATLHEESVEMRPGGGPTGAME